MKNSNPEIGSILDINGCPTNYHDLGQGAPLLMLHGSGPGVSTWANWRLNMPVFAHYFRVIGLDMLGFGYTGPSAGGAYSIDRWLQHVLDFLDALAVPQVSVVGNSFGGAIALAMAVHHPTRVDRLVLMGSAGLDFALTSALDAVWGYRPSVIAMRQLMDTFAYDRNLVTDELAELRYRASIRPGIFENYAKMFPVPRQRRIRDIAQSESDIARIQNPTLIIHGREDRVIPLSSSLRLHQLIHHSQLHVFGRCGHWTQIECSTSFNHLVADFIGGSG